MIKLLCKCGNVEELVNDKHLQKFEMKNCEDGTFIMICKNYNDTVFIKLRD